MPVLPLYTMYWKNVDGADMQVLITDRQGADPVAQEYYEVPLKPAHDPLITRYINSGESIYNPILGRSATIQFLNSGNTFLSTFSSGEDDRFYVNVSAGHGFIFEGFLVMEDNTEPYLPKGQIVTLTATDNLGLLKNIELKDLTGAAFRNEHTLIDYVVACLKKTALGANINIVSSLYGDNQDNRWVDINKCAWNQTYLNAWTFENNINEAEDCYTVLSKIISSWKCRLSYYSSEWWIIRLDEYKNGVAWYTKYDATGAVLAGASISANLLKTIDHASRADKFFINKSTLVRMQRPRKSEKETFNYVYPKEIICNIDFDRGDVIDDTDPLEKTYEIECWTFDRGFPGGGVPTDNEAYIKRFFVDGYETERYLVVEARIGSNQQYVVSEEIPVNEKDRFDLSFDFRLSDDVDLSGSSRTDDFARVYMIADDASEWTMDSNGIWFNDTNRAIRLTWNDDAVDEREWRTISVTSTALPKSGKIWIYLLNSGQYGDSLLIGPVGIDTHFTNLRFTYEPYINGSYQKFTGEYYKITQSGNYSAVSDNELLLSDSPRKLFKGAMLYLDGADYKLTTKWDDWAILQNGEPGLVFDRFAKWQAYNVWNQFKTPKRIFDVNLKGLDSNSVYYCDIIHKYRNDVVSDHNQNKFFVFLHLEQNWRTCQMTGTMIEIHDTTEERNFEDPFEFRYLTR